MKINIISNIRGCSWAGSEVVWHLLAMKALKEGHQVKTFLHPDLLTSEQMREFRATGGNVTKWKPLKIARLQPLKEKFWPTFSIRELDDADVTLVSLGSLPAMCFVPGLYKALLETTSPLVILCQFNADNLFISPSERIQVADVLSKASKVVFVSERNLQEARRQFAIDPPGAESIGNPIRDFPQNPTIWLNNEIPSFACVARLLTAWKGQDILLDILSRPPWSERNWRLSLFGRGPDYEYLEKLISFLKLKDKVTLCGHVESLKQIWDNHHLLLLPSHGEGLPLAALEAMSYARPVIATDVGGAREIISEGVNGFLSDGSTAYSFGAALERGWIHRVKWEKMGLSARESASVMAASDPSGRLMKICAEVACHQSL